MLNGLHTIYCKVGSARECAAVAWLQPAKVRLRYDLQVSSWGEKKIHKLVVDIWRPNAGCCINKHAHMARPHLRGYMYVFIWKEFSPGSNEIFTNWSPCGWTEADIWSLFHCLAPPRLPPPPPPLLSRTILSCLRFKSSRALESGHGGLLSSQVALVVHVSNQQELKKADVSPNPGEVLRAAFRGWRGVKSAHLKLSAVSLSRAKIAIILFFISSFWLKCSSTYTPTSIPHHHPPFPTLAEETVWYTLSGPAVP